MGKNIELREDNTIYLQGSIISKIKNLFAEGINVKKNKCPLLN